MVVIVQQKNVLNPIVLRANIYAENQETADTPMHHIIAEMVIGHITELVPTTVTHQLESVMKNVLRANSNAQVTTQCIAEMDFGKKVNPVKMAAILQQENAKDAFQENTNVPITIRCIATIAYGNWINHAKMAVILQQENANAFQVNINALKTTQCFAKMVFGK